MHTHADPLDFREWLMVDASNFHVRLNNKDTNLDFRADLLGEVTVEERPASVLQTSGRFLAWMVLGASLFIAIAIAIAAGVI